MSSLVSIAWQDDDFMRAVITCRAQNYRWWRKRYVRADVELRKQGERQIDCDDTSLVFAATGVRVIDSDDDLARDIWDYRSGAIDRLECRQHQQEIAAKGNPWTAVEPLPTARVVGKS